MLGQHEIVVKASAPQLARVRVVAARRCSRRTHRAIVNPVQLVSACAPPPRLPVAPPVWRAGRAQWSWWSTIATVRKISSRLLEREGYQVITAKDGVDALAS